MGHLINLQEECVRQFHGAGSKRFVVCYYEASNNWWVAKAVRKKHSGTVLAVEWHPNSVVIATACVDRCVRIFNAFVKLVDKAEARTQAGLPAESKFGEELYKLDLSGWPRDLSFSPSGKSLAVAGHDSSVSQWLSLDVTHEVCATNRADLDLFLCPRPLR